MYLDFTKLDAEQGFFKKGSPHIFNAFEEVQKHLAAIANNVNAPSPPPPPPPPPPVPDPIPVPPPVPVPPGLTRITGRQGVLFLNKPTFLDGVDADYIQFQNGSDGSHWVGGSAGGFDIYGPSDIVLQNVDFNGHGSTPRCNVYDRGGKIPKRVKIISCSFKNYYTSVANDHCEALFLGPSEFLLVDGCQFDNNGNTGHIFWTFWGDIAAAGGMVLPGNGRVQNCRFGPTAFGGPPLGAYYSVNFRKEITAACNITVQPGQPTVVALCSNPEFVK